MKSKEEEEKREIIRALRKSYRHAKSNRKIMKEIIKFYGENEVAERFLNLYKGSILWGRSYKAFTDAVLTGFGEFYTVDRYIYAWDDDIFKIRCAGKDKDFVLETLRITYFFFVFRKKSFLKLAEETFPEWYEEQYVPAHPHLLRRRWKEKASKERISEENLLQCISYFFFFIQVV